MKTKELLADSFRDLVLTMPFQKISIKMITDGAHVIRPTFYNYFQDKSEVIEFLFDRDISSKVEVMIENDMEQEAIKLMFICFEKNKVFSQGRPCGENFRSLPVYYEDSDTGYDPISGELNKSVKKTDKSFAACPSLSIYSLYLSCFYSLVITKIS